MKELEDTGKQICRRSKKKFQKQKRDVEILKISG